MCLADLPSFHSQLVEAKASEAELTPINTAIELAETYGDPSVLGKAQKTLFWQDFIAECADFFVSLSPDDRRLAQESKLRAGRLLGLTG